jgi:hypothetical protein
MTEFLLRYRVLASYVVAGLVLVLGAGVGWAVTTVEAPRQLWREASAPLPTPAPERSVTPTEAKTITMSAVGDTIMGVAPNLLPTNDGRDFFGQVKHLFPADLVMANLEQTLTDDTGFRKCGPESANCGAFRAPPSYAKHFSDAGFDLLNQANNHGMDYGPQGYTNTQKAIETAGMRHTGQRGLVTVIDVQGVKVAVLGFSSYARDNSLVDLKAARAIVEQAAAQAEVVVIQVHWGAEGSDKGRVKPGTESFLGENRGDPIAFSRAVIDAGADLIIGHGPHTVRGMEVYKGRLIAHSIGNFAGGRALKGGEILGWGGVLKVTLRPDGSLVSGSFASTIFESNPGVPKPDPQDRALKRIRELTELDFPTTGVRFGPDGTISTL